MLSEAKHLFYFAKLGIFRLRLVQSVRISPILAKMTKGLDVSLRTQHDKGKAYAEILRVDFKCFQAKGEGSYLEVNDRAL